MAATVRNQKLTDQRIRTTIQGSPWQGMAWCWITPGSSEIFSI